MAATKRLQARLSFDDRMGPLWEWLHGLGEGERRIQLMYLIQLGFDAREGLRNGRGLASQPDAGDGRQAPGRELEPRAPKSSAQTRESREGAADALAQWTSLGDMAGPPE